MSKRKTILLTLFFVALWYASACHVLAQQKVQTNIMTGKPYPITIAIHGGAGTILKENMPDSLEQQYRQTLKQALFAGYAVLQTGGTSLDAVQAAIVLMENSPLFNAGKGAVLTHEGTVELDAAIMDGSNIKAGAVGGVKTVKNPIIAARRVMENSPHVMMIGEGADAFAKAQGLETEKLDYFITDYRLKALEKILQQEKTDTTGYRLELSESGNEKYGTVGAVALDQFGNLAAGTSTGGMTNKKFGRIGDSPIIGAGTYANNHTCAVSATGHGEFFMRNVAAYDVSAMIEYAGLSVQEAAQRVIFTKLLPQGGSGGLIVLDTKGNLALPFNTEGMYRGFINNKTAGPQVFIYKNE